MRFGSTTTLPRGVTPAASVTTTDQIGIYKKSLQSTCHVHGNCSYWSISGIRATAAFSGTKHDAFFHPANWTDLLCFVCCTQARPEHGSTFQLHYHFRANSWSIIVSGRTVNCCRSIWFNCYNVCRIVHVRCLFKKRF